MDGGTFDITQPAWVSELTPVQQCVPLSVTPHWRPWLSWESFRAGLNNAFDRFGLFGFLRAVLEPPYSYGRPEVSNDGQKVLPIKRGATPDGRGQQRDPKFPRRSTERIS